MIYIYTYLSPPLSLTLEQQHDRDCVTLFSSLSGKCDV